MEMGPGAPFFMKNIPVKDNIAWTNFVNSNHPTWIKDSKFTFANMDNFVNKELKKYNIRIVRPNGFLKDSYLQFENEEDYIAFLLRWS